MGLARALGTSVDDVGTIAFPYSHIGGPDYIAMMPVSGFPAILIERFTPAGAVAAFVRHGAMIIGGSTAFYQMFLAEDELVVGPAMPRLRTMAGGGAPKPPEIYFEVLERMGVPIAHGYRMTDDLPGNCLRQRRPTRPRGGRPGGGLQHVDREGRRISRRPLRAR